MRTRTLFFAAVVSIGSLTWAADLQVEGGAWTRTGSHPVARQADHTSRRSSILVTPTGTGTAWRCVVEPGPHAGTVGLRFGASKQKQGGYALSLSSADGGTVLLHGPAGVELWRDQGVDWPAYSPMWLEGVLDFGRVRVQVLEGDAQTLLAQSPWLAVSVGSGVSGGLVALSTDLNTARFCFWERAETPLSRYTPDNPSALRVPQANDPRWATTGGGAWRWRTHSRQELLQTRRTERTTAFVTSPLAVDGTWRCRVRLDEGTCGGGMLIHADRDLATGYLVWLGGSYGNGRLMLYRFPTKSMWSGTDGKWHWDVDYVLEATIRDGTIQAVMLAADGATVIDKSPVVQLGEGGPVPGMLGFQTWRGTGRFSAFRAGGESRPAHPESPSSAVRDLGSGWSAGSGTWSWADPERVCLLQTATQERATATCDTVRGAVGTFRCRARTTGASAISLLFQASADGRQGFECRLDTRGLQLRDARGDVLWEGKMTVGWEPGVEVTLEGVVATDRVRARVRDGTGRIMGESLERYVPDTNNDRLGVLGVACENGAAAFRGWSWTAE